MLNHWVFIIFFFCAFVWLIIYLRDTYLENGKKIIFRGENLVFLGRVWYETVSFVVLDSSLGNTLSNNPLLSHLKHWTPGSWQVSYTVQQQICTRLKTCNFEDFCVLNPIGTFILHCKLLKMVSKLEKSLFNAIFETLQPLIGRSWNFSVYAKSCLHMSFQW